MARRRITAERRLEVLGLELSFECSYSGPLIWMPRSREIVVVGYITHDDNCHNPIEDCDGMGKFLTKSDASNFLTHVGRTYEGDPDLDYFLEIITRLNGAECPDQLTVALSMWEEAYAQGKVGTRYAQGVKEKWYRGGGGYREVRGPDEMPDIVWVPDQSLLEHINSFPEEKREEEAYKCFDQALEEYNKWAEGDCYGVVVEKYKRIGPGKYINTDDTDACWGYIGYEYAQEEMKDTFEHSVKMCKRQIAHKGETPCNSKPPFPSSAPSQTA